jgi:hypothetical protein
MKSRWNRTMLNLCGIVAAILKMATTRNFSMSRHHNLPTYEMSLKSDNEFDMWVDYDVPNWFLTLKISTDHHFQNGHNNAAKIKHCPISSKFDMWVNYDVPTLKNF